ncbi:MAG: hypothetical protein LBD12_04110 [Clostridiales Family XIII bacterium]|jgi:hypothetical protein|nr:hypothetical protein [Clostridiales Family XIII bacterium]
MKNARTTADHRRWARAGLRLLLLLFCAALGLASLPALGGVEGMVGLGGAQQVWAYNGYLEDCDANGYDDETGAPVPWPGYDATHGDTIPPGWDGQPHPYEYYFPPSGGGTPPPGGDGGSKGGGTVDTGSGTASPAGGIPATPGSLDAKGTGGSESTAQPIAKTDRDTLLKKTFANTPTPKLSGTAKVGKTLKAIAGKWETGTKISYQWQAEGKNLRSQTKPSLKLTAALKGKKVALTITATKVGYLPEKVKSKTVLVR